MGHLSRGDPFPNLRLETVGGRVELAERWRSGPLVVVFMRHFGCAFCREHLVQMSRAFAELRGAGGDVVAVFQYGASATRDFCQARGVPFDCLGDPLREGYTTVSLGRGNRQQLLGWRVAKRFFGAARVGGMGGPSHGGDMAQLPGTFVIGRDGKLVLAHYNADSADNPPVEGVLAAVRAAGTDGGYTDSDSALSSAAD